jgi:5-carboxymethyl-2-hydroxymuconate isomerase
MPHIIAEYSKNVGQSVNLTELVQNLQDALVAQGGDRSRIKSRAVLCDAVVVGDKGPDGAMVHITLLLLEGREIATKQQYGEAIYEAAKSVVLKNLPECSVTLEVRDMAKETYIL